jgi:hypothetical protein
MMFLIQSPEYGKLLDNMAVARYCPIRLLADLDMVTYEPKSTSLTMTPTSRPSVTASIADSL